MTVIKQSIIRKSLTVDRYALHHRYLSQHCALAGLALVALLPVVSAQPASRPATFEVASIKRNTTCGARRGSPKAPTPGRIYLECQTVWGLMLTSPMRDPPALPGRQ